MSSREIQPLFITVLKEISKQPSKYATEEAFKVAFSSRNRNLIEKSNLNIVQLLVDYITDAGRFTDDVLPNYLFAGSDKVTLKNSKISGKYLLKVIGHCNSNLILLDVSGCFQVDDLTVQTILQSCPNLNNINIKNCRKLTDATLVALSMLNSQLLSLNIGGNFNMSVKGVATFIDNYRFIGGIKDLNLSGLMINDHIISKIASKCTGLVSLGVGFSDVSEEGLTTIFLNLGPQLSKLNVSWLASGQTQISTSFLMESIATHCPRVVDLDVSGMKNFTSTNLTQLIETRLLQHQSSPQEWHFFQKIHAKFISHPKSVLETAVCPLFPGVLFNL